MLEVVSRGVERSGAVCCFSVLFCHHMQNKDNGVSSHLID